jgi:hypothetical protein
MGTLSPPASVSRRTVTFAVRGLTPRDEALLKSYVRLLAHRTRQAWKPADGAFDVLVVAQGTPHAGAEGKCTLVVGPQAQGEPNFVRYPFHADELEAALNAVAAQLVPTIPNVAEGTLAARLDTLVTLLRWPPAHLVASATHIRLATVLTGRSVTLAQLQQLAGSDHATCTRFVAELAAAGVLGVRPAAERRPARATEVQQGLLDRIRRRLGRVTGERA